MIQTMKKFRKGIAMLLLISSWMIPCSAFAGESACEVELPVYVEVTGDKATEPIEFEISLTGEDAQTPMPEICEKKLKDMGEISFGPIRYTVPEDYHYVIRQKIKQEKGWTYDKTMYEVTVRIVNNEEGELVSEIWAVKEGSDEKSDKITFINYYKATTTPTSQDKTPQTGDNTRIYLAAGLMMASLLAILACFGWYYRKRHL